MTIRYFKYLLLGVIGVLPASPSWAALNPSACAPPVRMDDPGGTMENAPVRDQGQLGICFAEVEAEQLSAIQRKMGIKNPIEPSGVAIAAGLSVEKGFNSFLKGGDPCAALSYAKRNGVCSVADIENRNDDPSGALVHDLGQRINLGENMRQSYDSLDTLQPVSAPYDPCLQKASVIREIPDKALMSSLMDESCDLSSTVKKITKNCTRSPPHPTIQNPFEKMNLTCKRFPGGEESSRVVAPSEYVQRLNKLLDGDKPLPPVIGFCPRILTESAAEQSQHASTESCGGHAVLVIGRREVAGKCQFLLRNTWGPECDHYAAEVQDQCEEGKGNIWVDAETLAKNMHVLIPPPEL
jgi:hypothetical protein